MLNKQLSKIEFQKRSTLVSKLVQLIELRQNEPVAAILSVVFSPHVSIGNKHPYRWTDNETLGIIEKEIQKVENGEDED